MQPISLYFTERESWRAWLMANHSTAREIWLLFYKKHTKKPCLPYEEAVEEALCFGWIDGRLQRLDEERHIQRYSPRRPDSIWSDNNKERVRRMLEAGRMTEAGLALVEAGKTSGRWYESTATPKRFRTPSDLVRALKDDQEAYGNFKKFSPSTRHHYIYWVKSSKKPETRMRRIRQVVERARQNKRPGVPLDL